MGALVHIGDQFGTTVEPRILEQYKDSTRWKACLKAVVDQMQLVEDAGIELASVLDFMTETPTGERLDWLAGLVNLKRNPEESDTSFFARFVAYLDIKTAGTPDNVIYNSAIIAQTQEPQYMDEAPATFFVYTGSHYNREGNWTEGGHQLSRSQVKKMAPAGVLGLPGMCIGLADGTVLGTYAENEEDRKMLLVAGDDAHIERELLLEDNNGNILVSNNSVPIRVTVHGSSVPDIPVIETTWNGVPVDAVRIKDLPDAGLETAYMVRDSATGGTTRIDEHDVGLQMESSGTNTLRFFTKN